MFRATELSCIFLKNVFLIVLEIELSKHEIFFKNHSEKISYISGNGTLIAKLSYFSGGNLQSLKNENFLYFS